jgi:hypothetical protein
MSLLISFSKGKSLLTMQYSAPGKPIETIKMEAHSGGWDGYKALPVGKWLITENPSGDRSYFALFYQDAQVNDQFLDSTKWRDGIRFGFHTVVGSHGCIMTKPAVGQSPINASQQWKKIQKLIRTVRARKIIKYQNNENPKISDNTVYHISSFGIMEVIN